MGLRPTVHAFADDHKQHLPVYWTHFPSPHATGTNAIAQVWHRHQLLHINSLWGMIPQILEKLKQEGARAVIFAPRWQSALWWLRLESMRQGPAYRLSGRFYRDRDRRMAPAPMLLKQVCLLDKRQMGRSPKSTKSICIKLQKVISDHTGGHGCTRRMRCRDQVLLKSR